MIGILCSPKKEKFYAQTFHHLLNPSLKDEQIPVLIFSLANTNIVEKTVFGNLVSEKKITPVKVALPSLIFNFTVFHTKSNMKKFKGLMGMDEITIINSANRFNQWSVMEMLLSNSKTKKYVLPFHSFKNEDVFSDFSSKGSFIIEPTKGSKASKIIYGKQMDFGAELYNTQGKKYFHALDIGEGISPIVQKGEWILLNTPDLLTYKNKLFVMRSYLQKGFKGNWEILSKVMLPQNERFCEKLDKKMHTALMKTANLISCFITDLNFCYIDFVLDLKGDPYFLNFGGFDNSLLDKDQSADMKESISNGIIQYAKHYNENI